jgi:hypothetical protein
MCLFCRSRSLRINCVPFWKNWWDPPGHRTTRPTRPDDHSGALRSNWEKTKTMSNALRLWNSWFTVSSQTALLALEAQSVIALRCLRVAAGGALAQSEMTRMITEKVQALGEAQTAAAIGTVRGRSGRQIAKKVAGVYKKRVRGNRRRLTR